MAQSLLDNMSFRCIGPPRGGRSVAVSGHPSERATFYFGAVAGGIWKTVDAGTTWHNISDGFLETSSVGALTVSETDPSVIYAGMGESTIRNDVSHGDGVYRSGDGGQTWVHKGLGDTRHIGEIRVHPKNPDLVYVAALGHAFGPNEERGVFRSKDGGDTWEKILYKSDKAGSVDLSFDPRHPEVIYAAIWETYRNFWEMSSGGPGSGLWKSTDGGDTWTEITENLRLPNGAVVGKIGVTASPVKTGRVWALVESTNKPGMYLSDDFGETWLLVNEETILRYRPWYYMHVFADTQDPDTVWVSNLGFWKSTDAGRTWTKIATPHGDNHDLWIDPNDNQRMIQSNDGGANISFNGGESFGTIYNQLTAQLYTVATDNREPYYHVYATQQDNSSIAVPSGAKDGAIVWGDCYPAGSGESGFIAVDPTDDDVVYVGAVGSSPGGGGALQRYDHKTGQIQLVNVWPEEHGGIGPVELTHRFPWTFPIVFSPHDSNMLYTGGDSVFRTIDEGHSWERISPDLTRNDPGKLTASGGPITKDTSGAEHYCTLATLRECPIEQGVIWAGSDDGLVHVTRDNGKSWEDVTPADLAEWTFVRTLEPSLHTTGTVYLAATRYKLDDYAPYLWKTTDYGQTWTSIVGSGLPEDDFVRVIRADPAAEGLLYLGTERGLYVSANDGDSWRRWQSNFPVTPVYDITIHDDDLVIGTHGRSLWIMDDLSPLRDLVKDSGAGSRLFGVKRAWRILPDLFDAFFSNVGKDYWVSLGKAAIYHAHKDETGQLVRDYHDSGASAPRGAILRYHLDADAVEEGATVSLTFSDSEGHVVREVGSKPAGHDELSEDERQFEPGPWITANKGVNRFVWDLRYPGATRVLGNKLADEANQGPLVMPGVYTARIDVTDASGNTTSSSQTLEVSNDPRSNVSAEDLASQLDALIAIRDKISETHEGINQLRSVRDQLNSWTDRSDLGHEQRASATRLIESLDAIEDALILPGEHKDTFGLHERSRLNEKLASVLSVGSSADAKPSESSLQVAGKYSAEIDQHLEKLAGVVNNELPLFNALMKRADLPAVEL